jgi:hypothetical protein
MKRSVDRRSGAFGILSTVVLSLVAFEPVSVSDASLATDGCEAEARRAYAEALKLCRLADTPNPRLRCYEAAKLVYWRTLQECRGDARLEMPPPDPFLPGE